MAVADADPGRTPGTADLVVTGIGTVLPPEGHRHGDEWFDYRGELGPSGYKYVPQSSRYALGAAKRALADARLEPDEAAGRECGVALASNNCASQMHGETDRAVLGRGLNGLRPTSAPFFSVNLFLSRLAIEHGLKGFSLALHTPRVAGLEAIESGARAVALGRASWLVAGVTEGPLDGTEPEADRSEDGSVVLTMEPAGRAAGRGGREYGRVRARSFFLSPVAAARDGADAARRLLTGALAGTVHGDPAAGTGRVRLVADSSPVADAVAAALAGHGTVERTEAGPGALGAVVQVADALRGPAGTTLVVAATGTGNVAVTRVVAAG
ncbi:beta-ketoacyl synthase N-terminal-like domain-containing protein [Streptomyces pactum]|uniref:beta-ketoacyl synthase N-terminal-like domain-containing protein n=1 Tax=Streptomyces pactum TaxID=68249 RepID=UPI003702CB1E